MRKTKKQQGGTPDVVLNAKVNSYLSKRIKKYIPILPKIAAMLKTNPKLIETASFLDRGEMSHSWKTDYADDVFEIFLLCRIVQEMKPGIKNAQRALSNTMSAIHDGWALGRMFDFEINVLDGSATVIPSTFDRCDVGKPAAKVVSMTKRQTIIESGYDLEGMQQIPLMFKFGNKEFISSIAVKRFKQLQTFKDLMAANKGEAAKDAAVLLKVMRLAGIDDFPLHPEDFGWQLDGPTLEANYDRLKDAWNDAYSVIYNSLRRYVDETFPDILLK